MKAASASGRAPRESGKAGTQRRAILVLGMHRSGTSAVTRCLNLLGAELGEGLMPPVERNNPTGFWELAEAVEIHDSLLSALDGGGWADARPLPEGWMTSQAALVAQERIECLIRNEFAHSALWAIKDPRMCLFVPLWREALTSQGIDASAVLVVRHPSEVATSLKLRDALPRDASHLIWFKHLADAEYATRGLPRSMVTYGNLLSDWRSVLARVAGDLRLTWPVSLEKASAAIDAFLDKGQRHHATSREAGTTPEVLAKMFEYCADLSSGKRGWEPVSRLVDDYRRVAEPLLAEMGSAVSLISGCVGKDRAELYFRSQTDVFSGDRVCRQVHAWATDPATLRFELPRDAGAAHLRFDPSLVAGAFHVSGVRVNGQAVANLGDRIRSVNTRRFDQVGGTGIGFTSFDDDPYIEFDMQDVLPTQAGTVSVEIDCRKLDIAAAIGSFLASEMSNLQHDVSSSLSRYQADVAQDLSALRIELGGQIETLQTNAAQLEAGLAAGAEREKHLSGQVDDLRARKDALQKQFDEGQTASQSRIAQLEAELADKGDREARALREAFWMSAQSVRAKEQLDSAQGRLKELEGRHSVLEADHVLLVAQLRNQQARSTALQAELAEIKASTLWRVLARIRGVLLKLPRGLRLLLRRGMKMVWWLLTPWRMPSRIRFLRARKRAGRGSK